MTIILLLVVLMVGMTIGIQYVRVRRLESANAILRTVVDHQPDYTFLIDKGFEVKETNVRISGLQPRLLGNVLHCKNSHTTGLCGESEECKYCPLRFVISKTFERGDNFKNFEACMELEEKQKVNDVDVSVDGMFVNINNEPHMVVNVKNVTVHEGGILPKVLFISNNDVLYNMVRESLGHAFRVLHVETEHQALHRLLRASDYRFCAVMTDSRFFGINNSVTEMLTEGKRKLPVIVFTKDEKEMVADESILYIKEDFNPEHLLKTVVSVLK